MDLEDVELENDDIIGKGTGSGNGTGNGTELVPKFTESEVEVECAKARHRFIREV